MSAPDELRQLADRLAAVRHYECDDCWYSCPESDEGSCNDAIDGCICNAPLCHAAAVALRHHANLLDAVQAHRDAPDIIRFKGYKAGRFSAADTHLYAALDAAAVVSPPPAPKKPYCPCGGTCHRADSPCSFGCIEHHTPPAPTCPTCGSNDPAKKLAACISLALTYATSDSWHQE